MLNKRKFIWNFKFAPAWSGEYGQKAADTCRRDHRVLERTHLLRLHTVQSTTIHILPSRFIGELVEAWLVDHKMDRSIISIFLQQIFLFNISAVLTGLGVVGNYYVLGAEIKDVRNFVHYERSRFCSWLRCKDFNMENTMGYATILNRKYWSFLIDRNVMQRAREKRFLTIIFFVLYYIEALASTEVNTANLWKFC